jgi:ABC-type nickel/cobalt efflux system permease component RcnA
VQAHHRDTNSAWNWLCTGAEIACWEKVLCWCPSVLTEVGPWKQIRIGKERKKKKRKEKRREEKRREEKRREEKRRKGTTIHRHTHTHSTSTHKNINKQTKNNMRQNVYTNTIGLLLCSPSYAGHGFYP